MINKGSRKKKDDDCDFHPDEMFLIDEIYDDQFAKKEAAKRVCWAPILPQHHGVSEHALVNAARASWLAQS